MRKLLKGNSSFESVIKTDNCHFGFWMDFVNLFSIKMRGNLGSRKETS